MGEEAEALAEETQGRIEDALQRIAASRATIKSATNVAEAKVARASMERASKELKKDEDKKQIQVEKVDELQKQENKHKIAAEEKEEKEEDRGVAKLSSKIPTDVIVKAAQAAESQVLADKRKEARKAELIVDHSSSKVQRVIEDNKAKAKLQKGGQSDEMLAEAAEQAVIPSNVNV